MVLKKQYIKPDVVFEDFSLSTTIANGCETNITNATKGVCGVDFGGWFVFVSGVNECITQIEDGSMFDGLCYHVPNADNNVFGS